MVVETIKKGAKVQGIIKAGYHKNLGSPLKNSKHELKSPWGDLSKLAGKKGKKSKKH